MHADASRPIAPTSLLVPDERGAVRDTAWARPALIALLALTALLYLWDLGASGWANAYYSAAAQAGSQDWLAMLFGSFDPSNAITVDKTPAALWVMDLSARIFGVNAWSILVPQALEGVGAVWLLFLTVRRYLGPAAGLIAGAVLALTPIATLMFRYNNPDALLVLLLVAAGYATARALEHASTRWIVFAGALIGFAFLAKMLQAFVIIPVFAGVYLLAAPTSVRRRLWQVGAAALAVIVSAGWYVALIELWPADLRPYIGGSQTNSLVELIFGYNGFGRITGDEVGRVGGGGPFSEGSGILRLFGSELAGQVSWLVPAALLAFIGLLWIRRREPRTDAIRAQALLWGGWLVVTGLVFSLMGGIFHGYYTVALAPAIGALVAMGAVLGWRHRAEIEVRTLLAAGVAITAVWAAVILSWSPTFAAWLMPLIILGAGAAAIGIMGIGRRGGGRTPALVAAVALAAIMAAPTVASVATAVEPHTGSIPTAQPVAVQSDGGPGGFGGGPGRITGLPPGQPGALGFGGTGPPGGFPGGQAQQFGPPGLGARVGSGFPGNGNRGGGAGGLLNAGQTSPELVAALQAGADDFRWVAATTGSNNAAGLALSSGASVLSIGGFNGTDPSPTLAQFQAWVAAGEIHYYVAGQDAGGFRGAVGGSQAAAAIDEWVTQTFDSVEIGGVTVYDLAG